MSVKQVKIRCTVRRGALGDEYVVRVAPGGNEGIEFVSDSESVEPESEPTSDEEVPGFVRVWTSRLRSGVYRVLVPASGASDSMELDVPEKLAVS